jgi:heat-inducible transcriptional repressor
MLTDRRRHLLQFIVDDYVASAQPVGSGAIVQKYNLPVSSATVRSEMARLEDDGFIAQPHTSAGRVPTDLGYRYYVETLMREELLPEALQQTIRHQFHQAAHDLEEWARLAAAVIAARLHNAAVVTAPHAPQPRVRWVELVNVHELVVLLILVLEEARVLQHTLQLEQPVSQDDLAVAARRLSERLAGSTADEIRDRGQGLRAFEASVADAAAELLEGVDRAGSEPSFLEGVRDLLRQPEFADSERILALLELLEERNIPRAIPAEPAAAGDVAIVIGGEHPTDQMRLCSVITARYDGPSGLRGAISVVGPTRMNYPGSVATVRYISSLMEELLGEYFA